MTDSDFQKETLRERREGWREMKNKNKNKKKKKQEKNVSWTQAATMWRRPKITAPVLGKLCEGVPHPPRSCDDVTGEEARARTTTGNEKNNIKVCVSLHDVLFHSIKLKRRKPFVLANQDKVLYIRHFFS